MENLSGPIIVEENETHYLVGIHYSDRHLARDIIGRAWDGEKRRWIWARTRNNYETLCRVFMSIANRFEISDRNLTDDFRKKEKEMNLADEITKEDDWGFHRATDNWLQIKQLQSIEDKIDAMLILYSNSNDTGKDTDESASIEAQTPPERRHETPGTTHAKVHEMIAALTNDKIFNDLILREEANQSPIQRLHNKIRDEIRQYKDVEDEEIHQILEARFKKRNKVYIRRGLSLLPLIWFAQEEDFYASSGNGEPDIYQMLYLFNSTRVAVEKYDQTNDEMSRIHAMLCLSLGRIIWSKIRVRSMEEDEENADILELEKNQHGNF